MRWRLLIGVSLLALGMAACVKPIVIQSPTISGTPQVGQTLTVNPGQWVLSGTFTYQWQRCALDGTGCVDITAATATTFVPTATEANKRVRARVTNTNPYGAQTALTALTAPIVPAQSSPSTSRVSVASDGTQADGFSDGPALSDDGRYVAFASEAANLVAGDTNGTYDVFVHDTQTGTTTRVSVASDGTQGNTHSFDASLSDDGRYVAFASEAANLVPGDTNGTYDVFVHDTQTGTTTRVSVASDGTQANTHSLAPSLSGDGRYIAFQSSASNLVPDDTNGNHDIFVHDTQTGTTTRASVASDGTEAIGASQQGSLSDDGRYVAFMSGATNLVPDDTNASGDIFVHDTQTGTTTRVSVASDGTEANGWSQEASLSGDGRYVAFASGATNLVAGDTNGNYDIFVHDTQTSQTSRVSVATDGSQSNHESLRTSLSDDGRYIAFHSRASNLAPGDTNDQYDIFVHDRG